MSSDNPAPTISTLSKNIFRTESAGVGLLSYGALNILSFNEWEQCPYSAEFKTDAVQHASKREGKTPATSIAFDYSELAQSLAALIDKQSSKSLSEFVNEGAFEGLFEKLLITGKYNSRNPFVDMRYDGGELIAEKVSLEITFCFSGQHEAWSALPMPTEIKKLLIESLVEGIKSSTTITIASGLIKSAEMLIRPI